MRDIPALSIVIPVYNVENYLDRCLQSLIKTEGIEKTQIILVDDGSTDASGKISEDFSSGYGFIECFHKANGGLSDARNYGLEKASGKYVFFMDSDDAVIPGAMREVIKAAEESDADVLLWNGESVDKDVFGGDLLLDLILKHNGLPDNGEIMTGTDAMVRQIKDHGKYSMTAWLRACRRDFLIGKGILFEKGITHEDELWTPQVMVNAGSVRYIPETVYRYRLRADSIMRSPGAQERHATDMVHILNFLPGFYLENVSSEEQLKVLLSDWVNTYLYEIFTYEFGKFPCRKDIPRGKILRYAQGFKQKMKALFLCVFGAGNYTGATRVYRRAGHCLDSMKNLNAYARDIKNCDAVFMNPPHYGNLGDQAIFMEEVRFCESNGLRVTEAGPDRLMHRYAKVTPGERTVFITGGGNIGELWPEEERKIRKIIKEFRKNRIVIFPQTVYWDLDTDEGRRCFEESRKCYSSHPDLTLFVREKKSLEFMKNHMPEIRTYLVPDMVMLAEPEVSSARKGILMCMRRDKEKTLNYAEEARLMASVKKLFDDVSVTDTCTERFIASEERRDILKKKYEQFSSKELVVTDRLHGMIIAAVTNTPCIALLSRTGKIKGCYEWFKGMSYIRLANDVDEALKAIPEVMNADTHYDRDKIVTAMEPLRQILTGKGIGDE